MPDVMEAELRHLHGALYVGYNFIIEFHTPRIAYPRNIDISHALFSPEHPA